MILYLDTSSLVKLYIEETGTADVRELVTNARVAATSDVAYPEMRAALARRHRDGSLSAAHFRAAKRALDADWPSYVAVNATAALRREAGDVAERYRLRGFDAIHLASFMEILRTADGSTVEFSSFDAALNRAAAAARRSGRRACGGADHPRRWLRDAPHSRVFTKTSWRGTPAADCRVRPTFRVHPVAVRHATGGGSAGNGGQCATATPAPLAVSAACSL